MNKESKPFLETKIKIGQGSFGTVYKGISFKTESVVAIKTIDIKTIKDPSLSNSDNNDIAESPNIEYDIYKNINSLL